MDILTIIYLVLFFVYGLLVGSFLNVCIYRIPLNQTVVTTPSHCMSCNHKLAWYDLFPLFSYLFLGGKCRYCKTKISMQYPVVEGLNALLYMLTFLMVGVDTVQRLVACLLICLLNSALIVLSVIDIRTQEIPFKINVFIFVLAVIMVIIDRANWLEHIIGFFIISVPFFVLMLFNAMGGGDMKLYAVIGLFMGWRLTLISLVVASIVGAVFSIFLVACKKADEGGKTRIPFGPFIAISVPVALFWGYDIINWYITTFFIV